VAIEGFNTKSQFDQRLKTGDIEANEKPAGFSKRVAILRG
ncbi:uncharacterized protein METZ01_LOCUS168071, partial [marine metagenome]